MTAFFLLAFSLLAAPCPAIAIIRSTQLNIPLGILLLGEDGGREWASLIADTRQLLGPHIPIEFVADAVDIRSMQDAVDRLHAAHVAKIVVVPTFIFPHDPALEAAQYLLGRSSIAPVSVINAAHGHALRRVLCQAPISWSHSLGSDAALVQVLASHAHVLSHNPTLETVVLIAAAPSERSLTAARAAWLDTLAAQIKVQGHYQSAHGVLLDANGDSSTRAKNFQIFRHLLQSESRNGHALVVAVALESGSDIRNFRHALDGLFVAFNDKPLLPHPTVAAWIKKSAYGDYEHE